MEDKRVASGKPIQRISWTEKIANDGKWFQQNADWLIGQSMFSGVGNGNINASAKADMRTMYAVYNNEIPLSWFSHITDPLSAQDPKHAKFPAKVRPMNITRTTIDQLLGEWTRRPFKYRVENMGETGYNQFLEEKNNAVKDSITQLFLAMAQQEAIAQGATEEDIASITPDQLPLPETVAKLFNTSYKDKNAIRGQKWMKRAYSEYSIPRIMLKAFKDYLIAGEAITLKAIYRGDLDYRRLSPLYTDYDKSPDVDFIEDGDWATHMFLMTASEVVDNFYDELKDKDHATIENHSVTSSPTVFFDHINGLTTDKVNGHIPVYLTTWKGRKQVGFGKYIDPETGEPQEIIIDEAEKNIIKDYDNMEVEWRWVNEWYETWRIGDDIYVRKQPIEAQRNSLNNFSAAKGIINGRKYSDTHAPNISVQKIGIPYLIMYMIVTRTLELTIAKSKGKILLIDQNAIPRGKGWDEEKFFYYSEAQGYGLLNRNQIGVDKSWNQYTTVDMSLFDQIEQLISLQQHYKQEWDDIIGFSRQRKGQTFASETNSANEGAVFQSTVITEMIFAGFDEFVVKELQGLLDLSKFTTSQGLRRLYNGDVEGDILLEIDPDSYANAELGLLITDNAQDFKVLEMMKMQAPQFIQNNVKASTILEMFQAGNIPTLKQDLLRIEELEAKAEQASVEQENQAQAEADERQLRFLEYEKMLEEQLINVEYDRKIEIEQVKGQFNIASFGNPEDADNDGVPDATEILKRQAEMAKIQSQERMKASELISRERSERLKEYLSLRKTEMIERNKKEIAKEKNKNDLRAKRIQARTRPKK